MNLYGIMGRIFACSICCLWLSLVGAQSIENEQIQGATIDPGIRSEVEKHIRVSEVTDFNDVILFYDNLMIADLFQEDTLAFSIAENDTVYAMFHSYYYIGDDTIFISGTFGFDSGFGFIIFITGGTATVFHLVSMDQIPGLAYNPSEDLRISVEVPCYDTKLILSAVPDSIIDSPIYGYVEFKSEFYFAAADFVNGKEVLPRSKQRVNMKVYFVSSKYH